MSDNIFLFSAETQIAIVIYGSLVLYFGFRGHYFLWSSVVYLFVKLFMCSLFYQSIILLTFLAWSQGNTCVAEEVCVS